MTKKFALMVFGQPRYCEPCIQSIKKNLPLGEFDVYGFFWTYPNAPEIEINNEVYIKKQQAIYKRHQEFLAKIQAAIDFYALEAAPQIDFPPKFKNGSHEDRVTLDTQSDPIKYTRAANRDMQSQWYAQWKCFQMIEQSGLHYDGVLRLRLDVPLSHPLDIQSLDPSKAWFNIRAEYYFFDHVYYSSQENMKIICDMSLFLDKVLHGYAYFSITQGEVHLARYVKSRFPDHKIGYSTFGQGEHRTICNDWYK